MAKITSEFDSSRRSDVVNAYNAVEGFLKGYGYVTEIVTTPADGKTEATANAEENDAC